MSRLIAMLPPLLLMAGCCSCMFSNVTLELVDGGGDPAPVDSLRLTLDGAEPTDQPCAAEGERCSSFLVPVSEEGTLLIEALVDDVVVGSAEVEVVIEPHTPGQCCSGGFYEERTLTVQVPSAAERAGA